MNKLYLSDFITALFHRSEMIFYDTDIVVCDRIDHLGDLSPLFDNYTTFTQEKCFHFKNDQMQPRRPFAHILASEIIEASLLHHSITSIFDKIKNIENNGYLLVFLAKHDAAAFFSMVENMAVHEQREMLYNMATIVEHTGGDGLMVELVEQIPDQFYNLRIQCMLMSYLKNQEIAFNIRCLMQDQHNADKEFHVDVYQIETALFIQLLNILKKFYTDHLTESQHAELQMFNAIMPKPDLETWMNYHRHTVVYDIPLIM